MPETFPWSKIITMSISAVALVFSAWGVYYSFQSNKLSDKSNQISAKANKIAQKAVSQIYQSVRPQLSISVAKRKESDEYIEILDKGDNLTISYFLEIKNTGNATAKNIVHPEIIKQELTEKTDMITRTPFSSKVLGIGEKRIIDLGFTFKNISPEKKGDIIKKLETDYITIDFSLIYSHELDERIKYQSSYKCKIKSNEAVEIMSDIKKL